jgi:lysophospholipase L1-like esterase
MAGLMLRSSLDPADRQLCVYMLPECEQTLRDYSYSNLEYRYVPYGSSTSHPGSVRWISDDYWRREAFPNSTGFVSYPSVWVRLTRQGNTIRAYASDDGTTWTQIVKRFWKKGEIVAEFDDITDHDLPDELYAGLFVTAHNVSGGTVSATFDNVNGFDASGGEPQQIDHTVAVLGNSIADGWPRKYVPTRFGTILDSMLGNRIEVSTYGFPAYSVLRVETQGKTIYGENGPLSVAMAAKAQVYLVEFGPNAANIDNSPEAEAHFERDFSDMIDSLQNITPRPEIFVLLPLPATGEFHGIQPAILKDSIRPKMVKVAEEKGCRIIDLYPLFEGKPDRYYDVIHPNASGHYAIADVVYDSLDAYFQTTAVAPSSGTSAASRVSAGISCTRRGASLALHGREHETYTVSIFSLDGKLLQRSSKVSADGVLSLPREMARKAILVHIESITTPGRLVRSYIW